VAQRDPRMAVLKTVKSVERGVRLCFQGKPEKNYWFQVARRIKTVFFGV
jgi:hypothetical protein